jgi:preprotein translocase SecE subunit
MAEDKAKATKKRLVKNPETFRERALKSTSEQDSKSDRLKKNRRAVLNVFKPVLDSIGRIFKNTPLKIFRRPLRIIGRILVPVYFRNSARELKLVTWPSWKQSRQLTYAVLVFAVVFGAVIAGVDYGLDKVFRNILLK